MARPSKTGGKRNKAKSRKASGSKARKAAPAKDRKTVSRTKTKRHVTAASRKRRPVSGLATQLSLRTKEADELRQQQAATAEILKVISQSAFNLQAVLDALVNSAVRLCDADAGIIRRREGDVYPVAATFGFTGKERDHFARYSAKPDRGSVFGRAVLERRPIHVPDLLTDPELNHDRLQDYTRVVNIRSGLGVPLLRDGTIIGVFTLQRRERRPYTDKQIELVEIFANQAVIAIENTRLFDEVQARTQDLQESLQQQTATADVLKVISRSAFDLDSVMNTLTRSAAELCDAEISALYLREGDVLVVRGVTDMEAVKADFLRRTPLQVNSSTYVGRAILTGSILNIADVNTDTDIGFVKRFGEVLGFKAILFVPLMREGRGIGVFALGRQCAGQFSQREVDLVQTFADQAVIAIENVRLFDEVQAKTADLQEALQQQTATSEVLRVISSSSGDLQPVFKVMLDNALKICEASYGNMLLASGDGFEAAELHNSPPAFAELFKSGPLVPPLGTALGRIIATKKVVHVPDLLAESGGVRQTLLRAITVEGMRARTLLAVPMLRESELVGVIVIYRQEVRPFSEKQIELVTNFADQAVIAIENTRLLNETKEALERQTATADILKVIASSPSDVQPVFEAIAERSNRLVNGLSTAVYSIVDDIIHLMAFTRRNPEADVALRASYPRPLSDAPWADRARRGEVVEIPDVDLELADQPALREMARLRGFRSALFVPLLREGLVIGQISVTRAEPGRFDHHHVQLLQTFADQAVIAIGNVRMFEEVQAKTRDLTESLQQQTATADVLKVISTSPGELEPVFQAMLENAGRLCEAKFAMLILYEKETNEFRGVGKWNLPPAYSEFLGKRPIRADPKIPLGQVAITKQPIQVADVLVDQSYIERFPGIVAVAELGGARTLLQVPMLKDNELVGTIGIYRQEVRPFTDKQIALVQNFAAQAVIAIENARLLNELRQRTDDLSRSLDDLRTAQDRLVQTEKLASLGQLTAGIAHEIKNPLNFVNNFSALSAELTDELNDVLKPVAMDGRVRGEVDELTGLLKDNLEKVVQHGKRADSIVKNMLLHSREGSGERRSADINALVEESLNLAYHGARAEKPGFNITLKRALDPDAGAAELYPQEITRALLNLISNGFYAATRRKVEDETFEPVLSAATKTLGNTVEIRIRDNGTGIPSEVRERMFNPFFTTKPAGEGTGLGLSISHDIIVKQHGGRIDVETETGVFTEFIIILPRNAATHA